MKTLSEYPTPETDHAELHEPIQLRELPFCVVHIDHARDLERRLALCRDALEYYSNAPWAPYTAGRATDFTSIAEKALEATKR